jgi:eukaryotic-like serine/threonine-protein kinase
MAEQSPDAPEVGRTLVAALDATRPYADPAPAAPPARAFERGDQIEQFLVIEKIGEGAMGVVVSAYDPGLDRKVAIKLLKLDVPDEAAARNGRAWLLREAQAMARLSHPNVVTVHAVGTTRDAVFVAMEFIDGPTLAAWLAERPRPWPEVVEVFVQAGRGLEAAHAAGLVHRDFKPDNVLIRRDGRVCVSDFGLASTSGTAWARWRRAPATIGPRRRASRTRSSPRRRRARTRSRRARGSRSRT